MDRDSPNLNHTRRRSTLTLGQSGGMEIRSLQQPKSASNSAEEATRQGSRGPKASPSPDESDSDWERDGGKSYAADELQDDEETGLTHADKSKRRKRKRRNTRLDERVVASSQTRSELNADRIASLALARRITINAALVLLWYASSVGISVFNKKVLDKHLNEDSDGKAEEKLKLPFPLFFTSIHMIVQFCLASIVLYLVPAWRPKAGEPFSKEVQYQAVSQDTDRHSGPAAAYRPLMTKLFYFTRIAPCGAATALDIGMGNMSLGFISLTFYTMCKSSVLGFVLLFAILFRLEQLSWRTVCVIAAMTIGVVMMVAGETAFNVVGFVLVMSASFCSGFRWSLTQILLLRHPATSNPLSSIFFLAPIMFITLLAFAFPLENVQKFTTGVRDLSAQVGVAKTMGVLILPGFLAFSMTAAEFALLKRTSVVTLSVCGIFKEVLLISFASRVFGDVLTPINISGLVITIVSIAAYNFMKFRQAQAVATKEAYERVQMQGLLQSRSQSRVNSSAGLDDDHIEDNNDDDDDIDNLKKMPERKTSIKQSFKASPNISKDRRTSTSVPASQSERQSPSKRPQDLD